LAVFERLRRKHEGRHVFMFAFDLLELDGKDLRREPIEVRKATLASVLRSSSPGLQLNQHLAHPGDIVFRHACKLGFEGIVSKRLGSPYRSGRSPDWLKFKGRTPRREARGRRIGTRNDGDDDTHGEEFHQFSENSCHLSNRSLDSRP
jgi:ATP-dependent DNA ligase